MAIDNNDTWVVPYEYWDKIPMSYQPNTVVFKVQLGSRAVDVLSYINNHKTIRGIFSIQLVDRDDRVTALKQGLVTNTYVVFRNLSEQDLTHLRLINFNVELEARPAMIEALNKVFR